VGIIQWVTQHLVRFRLLLGVIAYTLGNLLSFRQLVARIEQLAWHPT
jgi:hypothetical protein